MFLRQTSWNTSVSPKTPSVDRTGPSLYTVWTFQLTSSTYGPGITYQLCDCRDPTTYDVYHDDSSIDEFVDANGANEEHNCYYAEAEPRQEQEKRFGLESKLRTHESLYDDC